MEDLDIQHEKRYLKRADLYDEFVKLDADGKIQNKDFHWLKPRLFTMWMRLYCQYRPEMAGYKEFRSSGSDYIIFFHNAPISNPDNLEAGNGTLKLFPGKSDKCKLVEGGAASDNKDLPF